MHTLTLKGVMCVCDDDDKSAKNSKGDENVAKVAENLTELREEMKLINKGIPILKSGKNGAIELDPKNPSHRDWYEGR